jgi:transposase-like protein
MDQKASRRKFTAEEKAKIVTRIVQDGEKLSSLAEEFRIQPSLLVQWKKQFFENASRAFVTEKDSELAYVQRKLAEAEQRIREIEDKKDRIISLVAGEMCELKKKLSETRSPKGSGSNRT